MFEVAASLLKYLSVYWGSDISLSYNGWKVPNHSKDVGGFQNVFQNGSRSNLSLSKSQHRTLKLPAMHTFRYVRMIAHYLPSTSRDLLLSKNPLSLNIHYYQRFHFPFLAYSDSSLVRQSGYYSLTPGKLVNPIKGSYLRLRRRSGTCIDFPSFE